MKIKTVLLSGVALRYAVAQAFGLVLVPRAQTASASAYWVLMEDGTIRHYIHGEHFKEFRPDEYPAQAEEIIVEGHISTVWDGSCWIGSVREPSKDTWHHNQTSHNRLVAAMRTFVSARVGAEVDLPDGVHCT